MVCPGSIGKGGDPSIHSATGTFAHDIAAKCLADDGNSPSDFFLLKGKVDGFEIECDMEMVEGVRVYVDAVNDDHQDGDEGEIEMPLLDALQTIDKDLGGTADFVRYRPSTKHLRVWDFKYGSGTYVEADDNAQMKVYALGALVKMAGKPIEDVTVTICQPRFEGAAPVRDFHFKAVELLEFAADVQEACERTRAPNPALVAGDHCKPFCPKRRTCPELEKRQQALVAAEFGPLVQYDIDALEDALANVPLVKARIQAIEEFAYVEANRGVNFKRFKLVDKVARRKYKSEGEAALFAQEQGIDPWEKSIISPATLEKKIAEKLPRGQKKKAAEQMAHLVEKVSSGTALVPVSDERPPVKLVGAADFPVLPA